MFCKDLAIPYGYDLEVGKLVENDREQRVIAYLEIWWSNGLSYDRMAEKLNLMNIPPKRNKGIWLGGVINKILARER